MEHEEATHQTESDTDLLERLVDRFTRVVTEESDLDVSGAGEQTYEERRGAAEGARAGLAVGQQGLAITEALDSVRRQVAALLDESSSEQPKGSTGSPRSPDDSPSPAAEEILDARARSVKVTVNIPENLANELRTLAETEGKTFTQALKEAISLKLFVAGVEREGGKLLIERRDGKIERIVFQ